MALLYSQVEPRSPDHLFPGWILTGDVSSVISVGGGGKGMLSADIMARISRGWPMPPYPPDSPLVDYDQVATAGNVIHIPLEDKPDETVWWRLNAAGADMTRIAYLGKVKRAKASGNPRSRFSLPEDLPILRSEIDATGDVRCVVIDPFMSAATTTVSWNQQLRSRLLEPLQELADDTGAAIWLLHHTTKGTNNGRLAPNSTKNLTDYVAGSKAFTDTLRMNTMISDSPDDDRIKVWQGLKSNGGHAETSLEYMIRAKGPDDADAHVEWRQPVLALDDPRAAGITQARILDQLIAAGQPMTPQAMVSLVRLSYALVDKNMRALEAAGRVEKHRGAYQALAPAPRRAVKALGRLAADRTGKR
jgi:AAA domain-containing protein